MYQRAKMSAVLITQKDTQSNSTFKRLSKNRIPEQLRCTSPRRVPRCRPLPTTSPSSSLPRRHLSFFFFSKPLFPLWWGKIVQGSVARWKSWSQNFCSSPFFHNFKMLNNFLSNRQNVSGIRAIAPSSNVYIEFRTSVHVLENIIVYTQDKNLRSLKNDFS